MTVSGSAIVRAANALLAAFGGDEVSIMLPATAMTSDAAGQLGLVDPGVKEVVISPVVTHVMATGNLGPRRRVEFTLPASAIAERLPELGMGTVDDVFNAALGLSYGSEVFHIESVVPEEFAGTIYFYVVTAVE